MRRTRIGAFLGDLASGIDGQALIPTLETLSRGQEPFGVVCGTK